MFGAPRECFPGPRCGSRRACRKLPKCYPVALNSKNYRKPYPHKFSVFRAMVSVLKTTETMINIAISFGI